MSTTWRHCRRSAARRQTEWTPVLKDWTSRDTVLNHVSRGRPLDLLHPTGGLLIAATTTLWWSSSYDLLVEAFSCAPTWRQRSTLWYFSLRHLWHGVCMECKVFSSSTTCQRHLSCLGVDWSLSRCRNSTVGRAVCKPRRDELCAGRDWWLPNMAVRLCHTVASYADSSPNFCVTGSISVLCASKVDEGLYKFHICVAYSNSIFGARWIANLLYLRLRPVDL